MPGLLDKRGKGLLSGGGPVVRQISAGGSGPIGPGWMAAGAGGAPGGGPPAYGSDEWALQTGGPGALLMRQVARGMAGKGNPLAVLDASQAAKFFTPETVAYLAPQYQAGFRKAGK